MEECGDRTAYAHRGCPDTDEARVLLYETPLVILLFLIRIPNVVLHYLKILNEFESILLLILLCYQV